MAEGDLKANATVTGVHTLDWKADGTYLMQAEDVEYTMAGSANGQQFTIVVTHDSEETGRWSGGDGLSDGTYSLAVVDNSRWKSSSTLNAGGVSNRMDGGTPALWSDNVAVRCDGNIMHTTVTQDGVSATVDFSRLG